MLLISSMSPLPFDAGHNHLRFRNSWNGKESYQSEKKESVAAYKRKKGTLSTGFTR